jgi:hypothetical protein
LDTTAITGRSALVVLPAWSWQRPLIEVGRKNQSRNGELLMPIRVSWLGGSVAVIPEGMTEASFYTFSSLGHTNSGIVSVTGTKAQSPVLRSSARIDGQELPACFTAASGSAMSVKHLLTKLVEEGSNAQWELTMTLDAWCHKIFYKAVCAVVNEMGVDETVGKKLINDENLRDELRGNFILGTEEKDSPALRLIDRCIGTETFAKVDPQKYVATSIRENAERAFRVAIDDPRTGRKVRTLARELGTRNPDEILEVYRARFPKERTGRKLVIRALTPAAPFDFTSMADAELTDLVHHKSDLYGNPIS